MKALLLLACAGLLCAETKQERGERVVEEALTALGGEKFTAMKDRVETGRAYSFYRDRLTGLSIANIYTQYTETPGKNGLAMRERQAFGKNEDYYVLFNDTGGYVVTFRGARPMDTERYTRWVDSSHHNVLYILRKRLKEPGLIIESKGTTVWQNTPVEIVDITDSENNVVTVYFQQSTKLPLRQEWVRRDPKSKERIEEVSVFSKYRDVGDGVQWPYSVMAERNGEKVFQIFSDSVAINQGFDDGRFTLGGETKVLPAEN